jgi:cytochrome c oxidase assembly factor CtaG
MSLRALALDWTIDSAAAALLAGLAAAAALYLVAVVHGNRKARPARRWSSRRTLWFLGGLTAAAIDLCSGIGTQADSQLSAHMLEHTVIWVIVAPLLAAGAPVRLGFHALARGGRRRLAGCLHSRLVAALTSSSGSVALFSALILLTQIPAVYGRTTTNDYLHTTEHALYLFTALLVWAPLIGADPLPHRPGPRGQLACMAACMVPMLLIAIWLASAPTAIYGDYVSGPPASVLQDQRLAATIMSAGAVPAFAIPALARIRLPRLGRRQPRTRPQRARA